jgi:glutamyl/glutaminyl-tRNA synthetase
MILHALGLQEPLYGHLSLIVGDDGTPLSKRHGSCSLDQINHDGYLPIAIMNYLARLGHTCDSQELLDFDHLSQYFQLDKLSRSPARFDHVQLMYWQKSAIQLMTSTELSKWLGEGVLNQVPEDKRALFAEAVKANVHFPPEALEWAKIFFHDSVQIDADKISILRDAGEQFFVEAEQAFDNYGADLPKILADMKQSLGINGKKLFMPLRIALTGKEHGPELANIIDLLGKDKIKHRLGAAFKHAQHS